jgi:hypothetical protein
VSAHRFLTGRLQTARNFLLLNLLLLERGESNFVEKSKYVRRFILVLAFASITSLSSFAALGDSVSSVQADAQHMRASVRVTQTAKYAVHEMDSTGGATVREYVSPEGKVFGVAWQGPQRPDLQQVLGTYYQQMVDTVRAEKMKHPGRHPVSLHTPGLVVEMSGHQRAFSGRAYVPDMVPSTVQPHDIQ